MHRVSRLTDAAFRREYAVAAILSNWRKMLIAEHTAIEQLRRQGMTETDILDAIQWQ